MSSSKLGLILFLDLVLYSEHPVGLVRPVPQPVRSVGEEPIPLPCCCPSSVQFLNETSGVFSSEAFIPFSEDSNLSSRTIKFFPFVVSASFGQINTFGFVNSRVCIEKGLRSTCVASRANRPSFMADWIFLRKTLQLLGPWRKSYATCKRLAA